MCAFWNLDPGKPTENSLFALRERIAQILKEKLLELLGDPDQGRPLGETFRKRLLRQREAVRRGERGISLKEALRGLSSEE